MKTDVYSWRLTSAKKIALENRARQEGASLAQLLDRITQEWMEARNGEHDPAEQIGLHAAVRKTLGLISGNDPERAEQAKATIRKGWLAAMAASALIDTGGILALLDRTDRWHKACAAALEQLHLPLVTTEAVLTELFHLVGDNSREVRAAWKFVRSGALTLSSIADTDLPALNALMEKYRDRPMDFADATLVHLAERHSVSLILTVDHNDFETYRIRGNRRFRIVPTRDSAGTSPTADKRP